MAHTRKSPKNPLCQGYRSHFLDKKFEKRTIGEYTFYIYGVGELQGASIAQDFESLVSGRNLKRSDTPSKKIKTKKIKIKNACNQWISLTANEIGLGQAFKGMSIVNKEAREAANKKRKRQDKKKTNSHDNTVGCVVLTEEDHAIWAYLQGLPNLDVKAKEAKSQLAELIAKRDKASDPEKLHAMLETIKAEGRKNPHYFDQPIQAAKRNAEKKKVSLHSRRVHFIWQNDQGPSTEDITKKPLPKRRKISSSSEEEMEISSNDPIENNEIKVEETDSKGSHEPEKYWDWYPWINSSTDFSENERSFMMEKVEIKESKLIAPVKHEPDKSNNDSAQNGPQPLAQGRYSDCFGRFFSKNSDTRNEKIQAERTLTSFKV